MSDLISRQAAIEVCEKYNGQGYIWTCILNDIRKIPSAQPKPDEWCTDCKEYDSEKHCCPRFNRVIRNALKDAQPEQKKGKWKYIERKEPQYDIAGVRTWAVVYKCSECGFLHTVIENFGIYDYCPNCGAKVEVDG